MTCTCEMIWAESARPPMRAMYRVDPRCQIHGTEPDPRDAELASLRADLARVTEERNAYNAAHDLAQDDAATHAAMLARVTPSAEVREAIAKAMRWWASGLFAQAEVDEANTAFRWLASLPGGDS